MPTQLKIKTQDDDALRRELDDIYDTCDQKTVAWWSCTVAKRVLSSAGIDYESIPELVRGFAVNEAWRKDEARMHDVRQAGFAIHALAKAEPDPIRTSALRATGQAVASGHMREHAMVASDYAIQTIGLLYNGNPEKICEERSLQIEALRSAKIASYNDFI